MASNSTNAQQISQTDLQTGGGSKLSAGFDKPDLSVPESFPNRTDIENIGLESKRILENIRIRGTRALLEHNFLLGLQFELGMLSSEDLRKATDRVMLNLLHINNAAVVQLGSGNIEIWAPIVSSPPNIEKVKDVVKAFIPPKASGVVAIPCDTSGCSVYIDSHKLRIRGLGDD